MNTDKVISDQNTDQTQSIRNFMERDRTFHTGLSNASNDHLSKLTDSSREFHSKSQTTIDNATTFASLLYR